MELRVESLHNDDKDRYERFVTAQADGSFLQSWGWGAWQTERGVTATRIAVVDENHRWITAVTLIAQRVPWLGLTYLYAPYGPVMMAQTVETQQKVVAAMIDWVRREFPQSFALRLEPKFSWDSAKLPVSHSVNIQPGKTLVVNLQQDTQALLAAMHHKTRYNIKVAQRHDVIVTGTRDADEDALKLIMDTARRQGYKTYGLDYYKRLMSHFKNDGLTQTKLYCARLNDKVLAAGLMIDYGVTRTYLFGGSSAEQRNVMAPYLLHWQAMTDAKAADMHWYDFWGAETAVGKTAGFVRFKEGFGGKIVDYSGVADVVLSPMRYTLYSFLRKIGRI